MEAEIERLRFGNQRVRDETDELLNQRSKVDRQAADHRQKAATCSAALREAERSIEAQEAEARANEGQIEIILEEIRLKRAGCEESTRQLQLIDRSIEELKVKNKDMRALQFEQEKRVKIVQGNHADLEES